MLPCPKPAWLAGGKGKAAARMARWRDWRSLVRRAAFNGLEAGLTRPVWPPGVPLALEATFWVPRPKRDYSARGGLVPSALPFPVRKPDLANYVKGLEDAIDGIAYDGDQQIVDHLCRKRYADTLERLGVEVVLAVVD